MVKKEVLASLIDRKKASVLKVMLFSNEELCLKEISKISKVSMTSTFRILQELVDSEILVRREWKNSKVYRASQNEKIDFLKELFAEKLDGVDQFVNMTKAIKGIQQMILQGKRKKNQANILLIGNDIPSEPLDKVKEELMIKGFDISYLTLTQGQYNQMSKMGLYQGKKEILFSI